jgi:hypothetical protein
MLSNGYVLPEVGCDFLPRFQTRPWASATILGLDVARKDLRLRAPAKWKKYQTALFPWQLRGQIQRGNAACPTLPQFTVHCMLRRVLRTAHKDDLEIENSG